LPYPIEGHTSVKHQNYVYIIGGLQVKILIPYCSFLGYDGFAVVPTIIRYDLNAKKSEVLPTTLKTARENHVSALIEEDGHSYLLVIGGWGG
jgi:hypothetical protein